MSICDGDGQLPTFGKSPGTSPPGAKCPVRAESLTSISPKSTRRKGLSQSLPYSPLQLLASRQQSDQQLLRQLKGGTPSVEKAAFGGGGCHVVASLLKICSTATERSKRKHVPEHTQVCVSWLLPRLRCLFCDLKTYPRLLGRFQPYFQPDCCGC